MRALQYTKFARTRYSRSTCQSSLLAAPESLGDTAVAKSLIADDLGEQSNDLAEPRRPLSAPYKPLLSIEERLATLRFGYEEDQPKLARLAERKDSSCEADGIVVIDRGVIPVPSNVRRSLSTPPCYPKGVRIGSCAPLLAGTSAPVPLAPPVLPCMAGGVCPFLVFRCSRGHTWKSVTGLPACFSCPQCKPVTVSIPIEKEKVLKRRRPIGRQAVVAEAEKRGGALVSKEYLGLKQKHEFSCKEGHHWTALPLNILFGNRSWCPVCAAAERGKRNTLTIADMHETAALYGGEFVSSEYEGVAVKHEWRCQEGHTFMKTPHFLRKKMKALGADNALPYFCPKCNAAKSQTRKVKIGHGVMGRRRPSTYPVLVDGDR